MPGHLAVEQRPGHLRGAVGRGEAGAAGGEHHPGAAVDGGRGSPSPTGSPSGTTTGPVDRRSRARLQRLDDQRAGRRPRRRRPRRGSTRRRPPRAGSRRGSPRAQSPDLPPVFVSTRTSVITAALSTALTMSTTVSAGDRHGGQRLHLDAGAVGGAHGRGDLDGVVGDRRGRRSRRRSRAGGTAGPGRACAWRP